MSFEPLFPYQAMMQRYERAWCFGGGWACDGWNGKQTRSHDDVDIIIWRADQMAFRACFADWDWQSYVNHAPCAWAVGEFLELPAHNAHGRKDGAELEVLMLEREGDAWWFRRNPLIRMPAARAMVSTPLGFQVLNPVIAMLFKSNRLDAKDHHDFEVVLDTMEAGDRVWLKQSLREMDEHHVWLSKL